MLSGLVNLLFRLGETGKSWVEWRGGWSRCVTRDLQTELTSQLVWRHVDIACNAYRLVICRLLCLKSQMCKFSSDLRIQAFSTLFLPSTSCCVFRLTCGILFVFALVNCLLFLAKVLREALYTDAFGSHHQDHSLVFCWWKQLCGAGTRCWLPALRPRPCALPSHQPEHHHSKDGVLLEESVAVCSSFNSWQSNTWRENSTFSERTILSSRKPVTIMS